MRRFNFLLFDEYVRSAADSFSSDKFIDALGQCDQLAYQAIVWLPDAAGTLTITPEHSGDGRRFVTRTFPFAAAFTIGTTSISKSDPAGFVGLRYVRFRIGITGSATKAHVKLYVTCRDQTHETIL